MSIQKINIGGVDVEIEDVSARSAITNVFEQIDMAYGSAINTLNQKVEKLENSKWVKLNDASGNIEINQEFSEIRMIASVYDSSNTEYSFSCNYDSNIFHNSTNGRDVYFITGNPIANNYGCKFKYTVTADGKQYISVDSCYNGANTVDYILDVWIKIEPVETEPQ